MHENGYDNKNYNTQAIDGSYRTHSKTNIAGANTQLRDHAERYGAATLGLMVENDDWRADGFSIRGRRNVRTDVRDDADFQLYSASLEYEVQPLQDLDVVLGIGQHWQDREGWNRR